MAETELDAAKLEKIWVSLVKPTEAGRRSKLGQDAGEVALFFNRMSAEEKAEVGAKCGVDCRYCRQARWRSDVLEDVPVAGCPDGVDRNQSNDIP